MSLVIDKNVDFALLHHTDAGVGSSEINTNDCGVRRLANGCQYAERNRNSHAHTSAIVFLYRILLGVCGLNKGDGREQKSEIEKS